MRIATVFTTIKNLPESKPNPHKWIKDWCKTCGLCIKKCPTSAIRISSIERTAGLLNHIDREKCFPYFLENHGCSVCIKECQFNKFEYEELKKKFLEEVDKFNTKKYRPRILRKDVPYGKCIFFDESNGCKIHAVKPLECRISMGCKPYGEQLSLWFMLNHFVNENDPESVRQFAAYLKSGGKTLEGAELENLVPDKRKLRKILSFETL